MIKLKYVKSDTLYDISFDAISGTVVQVAGDIPEKAEGFLLYRSDGKELLGDYSQYKTVYRKLSGVIQYSRDGSVYPHTPGLEDEKKQRIEESKKLLVEHLAANPLISSAHGGKDGAYAVTEDKQALMMSNYMTYQIEKSFNPGAKLTWNESGKVCEEWTENEFLQLILEVKAYVYPLVSYQQAMEVQIQQAVSKEVLDNIVIDYTKAV